MSMHSVIPAAHEAVVIELVNLRLRRQQLRQELRGLQWQIRTAIKTKQSLRAIGGIPQDVERQIEVRQEARRNRPDLEQPRRAA